MTGSSESSALRSVGLGASHPRLRILAYLRSSREHPTAEQIFSALSPQMPTLSKMTVYNTVKAFLSKGLARDVRIEEGLVRYDADVSDHGHFKCLKCGRVSDFYPDSSVFETKPPEGCDVIQRDLFYRGVCGACSNVNQTVVPPCAPPAVTP